ETLRIEQRCCHAISREPGLYLCIFLGIGGKFDRKLFVSLRRCRYELRQVDCLQQTGGYPARKNVANTRQNRNSCPKRITSSSARVIRCGIEKQICDR